LTATDITTPFHLPDWRRSSGAYPFSLSSSYLTGAYRCSFPCSHACRRIQLRTQHFSLNAIHLPAISSPGHPTLPRHMHEPPVGFRRPPQWTTTTRTWTYTKTTVPPACPPPHPYFFQLTFHCQWNVPSIPPTLLVRRSFLWPSKPGHLNVKGRLFGAMRANDIGTMGAGAGQPCLHPAHGHSVPSPGQPRHSPGCIPPPWCFMAMATMLTMHAHAAMHWKTHQQDCAHAALSSPRGPPTTLHCGFCLHTLCMPGDSTPSSLGVCNTTTPAPQGAPPTAVHYPASGTRPHTRAAPPTGTWARRCPLTAHWRDARAWAALQPLPDTPEARLGQEWTMHAPLLPPAPHRVAFQPTAQASPPRAHFHYTLPYTHAHFI